MDESSGVGYTVEPVISYTVKDILGRVEGKLDAALISLASKAEHKDLVDLSGRVAKLELAEENRIRGKSWRTEFRRWAVPTLVSIGFLAVTILQMVH